MGQCAGFVGADHLGAAQRLHSGQLADHRIALGHFGNTDGKHHRYHGGQTLRDRGHCQGYGNHKGTQHTVQGVVTLHQKVEGKDEHADAQHDKGQSFAQLIQALLQGSLLILRLGKGTGDLTHFRVHTGAGDHGFTTAIDYG